MSGFGSTLPDGAEVKQEPEDQPTENGCKGGWRHISTHAAVLHPGAALLRCDVPVGGAFQQAVGALLLLVDRRGALAVQRLVALPQAQQGFAAPQLL